MRMDLRGRLVRLDLPRVLLARQLNLCALLVAFITPSALRAEFVIAVPVHAVPSSGREIALAEVNDETNCGRLGTCCRSLGSSPVVTSPLAAMLKESGTTRQGTGGAPRPGGPNNAPLPQNQRPLPRENCPPADSYGHGMGGTGAGSGLGAGAHPAGLSAALTPIDPELAMRLFARDAHLPAEEQAGRLFRPPRIS
jgi:hypothetical protein